MAGPTRQGTELRRFGSPKEIWWWDQEFLFCAWTFATQSSYFQTLKIKSGIFLSSCLSKIDFSLVVRSHPYRWFMAIGVDQRWANLTARFLLGCHPNLTSPPSLKKHILPPKKRRTAYLPQSNQNNCWINTGTWRPQITDGHVLDTGLCSFACVAN